MPFSGSIRRRQIPKNFVNLVKQKRTKNGNVLSVKHVVRVSKFT